MQVNVSPDMGMYHLLRSQGYDPAYAIAEFVDNALQAKLSCAKPTGEPVRVDVRFYSSDYRDPVKRNSIVVTDDGPGIAHDRLRDAMKPARPAHEKGLSEFGIGMKAAAVWFSDSWTLKTTPEGSRHTYELTFDLPELLDSGKNTVEVKVSQASAQGTTLALTQLRRNIDAGKFQGICNELRELYQRFTSGESPVLVLTAYHNDTPVDLKFLPADRAVLQAPVYKIVGEKIYAIGKKKTWSVSVDIVFEGASIQGFICLLERGSYTSNPGLVMFRHDRVIQGTLKYPNLPKALFKTSNKYARQRLYGELFVDSRLPVTYTKDGFEIDEEAFAEQLKRVDGMPELLRQVQEYRVKGSVTEVAKESLIPNSKPLSGRETDKPSATTTCPSTAASPADAKPTTASDSTTTAPKPSPPVSAFCKLLDDLKAQQSCTIALRAMMDEARFQYQFRRTISAAMCMRAVIELAVMEKLKTSFSSEYVKVSEKGIKALLNYMNSNPSTFFNQKKDFQIIKCLQGLATGSQTDIVLLNNASHGHYNPSMDDLNKFAGNVEALLRWAFI